MSDPVTPPYGACAPSALQSRILACSHALPPGWVGRRLASACNRLAGGKTAAAFDVEVFGGVRARLRPLGNYCEKRVFCSPQMWDARERASLADEIGKPGADPFTFLDVGANVGLYSLFALGAARRAGRAIRIACVEPGEEAARRLAFNIAANDAAGEITHFACAATRERGPVELHFHATDIGCHSLGGTGRSVTVEGRPLAEIVDAAGFDAVSAMKIDVEGAEKPALDGLFAGLDRARWPAMVILENAPPGAPAEALRTCLAAGYRVGYRAAANSVLRLAGP